tara:strand:- start:491 stop:793 length:303 start_codon:yes stop_codon:yes gene_type:complete
MKKILILITLLLFISSCCLFENKNNTNKDNAYDVAKYNYVNLSYAYDVPDRFLLVNKNGVAKQKDLFNYINDIKADHMKDTFVIKTLMQYNKNILNSYQE